MSDDMTNTEAWCRWYIAQAFHLWWEARTGERLNFVEIQRSMGLFIDRHSSHGDARTYDARARAARYRS